MPSMTMQPNSPHGSTAEWPAAANKQTRWDWRAVANFIGGGTGAGMLLTATAMAPSIAVYRLQVSVGLMIIALGLFFIIAKMGRPTRALNTFRQVRSSWMAREGFAMPTLFGCGALSLVYTDVVGLAVMATLSALVFVYAQARILTEAKGIPTWFDSWIVPLILSTGLAEGTGLGLLCIIYLVGKFSEPFAGLLFASALLRYGVWFGYRRNLIRSGAPEEALATLARFDSAYVVLGLLLPCGLVGAGYLSGGSFGVAMAAIAAALAMIMGWAMKYVIVVRAGFFLRKSLSLSAAMAKNRM